MGKLDIRSLGGLGPHANTLNEYDNEVSEELLDHHLNQIASTYEDSKGYVCYVLGMGAQPESIYSELRRESGLEVVWSDSILSGVSKILSVFMASYAGLVKIASPEKLPGVVKRLSHLSMAGIYIFDQSMERDFVERVLKNPLPEEFDFGIKDDSRYFLYMVDADNSESSTGIYEIVSYGKNASGFAKVM